MAMDWSSDPMAWLAGGGTALGIGGSLYGLLQGGGAHDSMVNAAQRQQRAQQAQQQQALAWMQQREAQRQALSQQPLNINQYQAPMQQAQIDALRREALSGSLAGGMPPDLAQRMFMTETLPRMIQAQYMQAAGLAQGDRQNQLSALGWIPSAQTQAGSLLPGGQNVLQAMGQYPRGGGMGDVSALGNYMKYQQMRRDQMEAQQTATGQNTALMRYLTSQRNPSTGPVETSGITGTSGYDSHNDRLGMPGLDTGLGDYGASAMDWGRA